MILFSLSLNLFAQTDYPWEDISPMPEARANNAVCAAPVFNTKYIYSFAGIDTTKVYSGISNRSWRMDVNTQVWEEIDPLPETNTKIAAGASYVNGKIYIIGGYTVTASSNEISSPKIHIYDPTLNFYEEDGADIPVPIDDHVQLVYNDSLIYVITGWSNSGNVGNVQVYDTYNNAWLEATELPPSADYRVFGGSGELIGDTIYYAGGARFGNNFPLGMWFRKGYINPENPLEIEWTAFQDSLALGYRQGTVVLDGKVHWIGGSSVSYNYDGIAYNGTGGVSTDDRVVTYDPASGLLSVVSSASPSVMDLRGIANDGENIYIIGGMGPDQTVQPNVFKYNYVPPVNIESFVEESSLLIQNPVSEWIYLTEVNEHSFYSIIGMDGKLIRNGNVSDMKIYSGDLSVGVYVLHIDGMMMKIVKE